MNELTQKFIIAILLMIMLGYMVFTNVISGEFFAGLIAGVITYYFGSSATGNSTQDNKGDDIK